jgi:hypothetical protein
MNNAEEQKRENRLKLLDDHIGRSLRESEASGELKAAPSYGKPLSFGDGYDETPDALKMPFKMLKDAGYAPPEVELMREIAALQAQLDSTADDTTARAQRQRLAEMRQQLALRLESFRLSGSF